MEKEHHKLLPGEKNSPDLYNLNSHFFKRSKKEPFKVDTSKYGKKKTFKTLERPKNTTVASTDSIVAWMQSEQTCK